MRTHLFRFWPILLAIFALPSFANAARPVFASRVDLVPGTEAASTFVTAVDPAAGLLYSYQGYAPSVLSVADLATHLAVTQIPLPTFGMSAMAVDSIGHTIYAVNGGPELTIVDTAGLHATAQTIGTVGHSGVAVDHALGRLYVTEGTTSGSVLEFDLSLNLLRTISIGSNPVDLTVDPATHSLFATADSSGNASTQSVYFLDPNSNTFQYEVPLGTKAGRVRFLPSVGRLYIQATNQPAILEVDVPTHQFVKSISLDTYPVNFAASADKVFFGNYSATTVEVLDPATDTVSALPFPVNSSRSLATNAATGDLFTIEGNDVLQTDAAGVFKGGFVLASDPHALALHPVRHRCYIADAAGHAIFVIGEDGAIITTIALPDAPGDVAVNVTVDRIYVTLPAIGDLIAIDAATNAIVWERPLAIETSPGTFESFTPTSMALDQAAGKLYVLHQGYSTYVSVVDCTIDGAMADPISHQGLGPLGLNAKALAFDATAQRLYVSTTARVDVGLGTERDANAIVVASAQDGAVLATMLHAQPNAHDFSQLALNSATGKLYASTGTSIDIFKVSPGTGQYALLKNLTFAAYPVVGQLAVNEELDRIYAYLAAATYSSDQTLHTIDGATDTLEPSFDPTLIVSPPRVLYDSANTQVLATSPSPDLGGVLNVYNDGPDVVQPTGVFATPATGSQFSAIVLQEGTVHVGDDRSAIASVQISLQNPSGQYWDGSAWVTSSTELFYNATAPANASGDYTFAFPSRAQGFVRGAYTLHAVITDSAGNVRAVASQFSIITPGGFAFSQPAYSVDEQGGLATITVTRSGGSDGIASVHYTVRDGSARLAEYQTIVDGHGFVYFGDYDSSTSPLIDHPDLSFLPSPLLTFPEGVSQMTFTIPITADELVEGSQTIRLGLQEPSVGAEIGDQSSAVLTILDHPPVDAKVSHLATIPLLPGPQSVGNYRVTYCPANGKIYALGFQNDPSALFSSSVVTVIDAQTGIREGSFDLEGITSDGYAAGIGIDSSLNRFYALTLRTQSAQASYDQNFYITTFDLTTHRKVAETPIPGMYGRYTQQGSLQVDSRTHKVFMQNGHGTIYVYDGATGLLEAPLSIEPNDYDLRFLLDEQTGTLYLHAGSRFLAIDEATGEKSDVGGSIGFGYQSAVNNVTGLVYSQSYANDAVSHLTKISGTSALATVALSGDLRGIAVDETNDRVYTLIADSVLGTKSIHVYDGSTLAEIGDPVFTTFDASYYNSLAVSPTGQKLYITDANYTSGGVGLIDLLTGNGSDVLTALHPGGMASVHSETSDKVYVSCLQESVLFVLDGATQTILKQIQLPGPASQLAAFDSIGRLYFVCTTAAYSPADQQVEKSSKFMVLDCDTDTLLADPTIDLGQPLGAPYSPDFFNGHANILLADGPAKKLYIASTGQNGNDATPTIFVVDVDSTHASTYHKVIQQRAILVDSLAINPVRHRLYASQATSDNANGQALITLDGGDLHTLSTMTYVSGSVFQTYQEGICVDTALDLVYIQSYQEETFIIDVKPGSQNENVVVGDLSNKTLYANIGYGSLCVAANPVTHHAFASDYAYAHGVVEVLDGRSRTITSTLCEAGGARALLLNAANQKLYIADDRGGTVIVLADHPSAAPSTLPMPSVPSVTFTGPAVQGDKITLRSTEISSAPGLRVRFQYQLSGHDDWTDIAVGMRSGNAWSIATMSVPPGDVTFRAVASATGEGDTPSDSSMTVQILPAPPLPTPVISKPVINAKKHKFTFSVLDRVAKTTEFVLQYSADGMTYLDVPAVKVTPGAKGKFLVSSTVVPPGAIFFRVIARNGTTPDSLPSIPVSLYAVDASVALRTPTKVGPFVGNKVISTSGKGQKKAFLAPPGVSETYVVRAVNKSAFPDSLHAMGDVGDSHFIVRYYSTTGSSLAPIVDADITQAVVDGTYALQVAPGGSGAIIAEVITIAGTPKKTVKNVSVKWISERDALKYDTIQLIGTATN